MKADLVCNALKMALERRKPVESVIMHTVRGSQYCPKKYQKMIRLHGLQCDMSGKSNCYDNAVYEGFFHTLKVKLIYQRKYEFRAQGKRSLIWYVEASYNRVRRHSGVDYRSPIDFEIQAENVA